MAYAALDRPAWKEVVGIVLACIVVLVLLVRLDRAAYEAQMDRARKAIAAERAERTPVDGPRASVPPRQPAPRTESLGDRGPIVIGIGGAWSAGTAATVPDVARTEPGPVPASGALRRITGPPVPVDMAVVSDAAQSTARPSGASRAEQPPKPRAIATAVPPEPTASRRPTDTLVVVLGGVGVALMALGGALVGLGRR